VFFKRFLIEGEHEENDEKKMRKRLKVENRSRKSPLAFEDLSQEQKNEMIIERMLRAHQLGLLPNTARTGIKEVD
jgi:hypothetical protein